MAASCNCAQETMGLCKERKTETVATAKRGKISAQLYVETTERRFNGVKRCC